MKSKVIENLKKPSISPLTILLVLVGSAVLAAILTWLSPNVSK